MLMRNHTLYFGFVSNYLKEINANDFSTLNPQCLFFRISAVGRNTNFWHKRTNCLNCLKRTEELLKIWSLGGLIETF